MATLTLLPSTDTAHWWKNGNDVYGNTVTTAALQGCDEGYDSADSSAGLIFADTWSGQVNGTLIGRLLPSGGSYPADFSWTNVTAINVRLRGRIQLRDNDLHTLGMFFAFVPLANIGDTTFDQTRTQYGNTVIMPCADFSGTNPAWVGYTTGNVGVTVSDPGTAIPHIFFDLVTQNQVKGGDGTYPEIDAFDVVLTYTPATTSVSTTPTGVQATAQAGDPTIFAEASVTTTPTGAQATAAAGDPATTGETSQRDVEIATDAAGTGATTHPWVAWSDTQITLDTISKQGLTGDNFYFRVTDKLGVSSAWYGPVGISDGNANTTPAGAQAAAAAGIATAVVSVVAGVVGVGATAEAGEPTVSTATSAITTPAGAEATAEAGTATVTANAVILPPPAEATAQAGDPGVQANVLYVPPGVEATAEAGDPAALPLIMALTSPVGAGATSAAGDPSVQATAVTQPSGAQATAQAGDPTVDTVGSAATVPAGVQATGEAGDPTVSISSVTTPAGAQASAQAGDPTVSTATNAATTPAGAEATAAAGDPTVATQVQGVTSPAGAEASAQAGSPAVGLTSVTTPAGAQATAAAGDVAVLTDTQTVVLPAGVQGTAQAGDPAIQATATRTPAGAEATAQAGSPAVLVTSNAATTPAGAQATAEAGDPLALVTELAVTTPAGVQGTAQAGDPAVIVLSGQAVLPDSVPSAEVVPGPQVNLTIYPSSVPSGELVGSPTVVNAGMVLPDSVPSAELVGQPVVRPYNNIYLFRGVQSAELVGQPTIVQGPYTILPQSVSSEESVGRPWFIAEDAGGIPEPMDGSFFNGTGFTPLHCIRYYDPDQDKMVSPDRIRVWNGHDTNGQWIDINTSCPREIYAASVVNTPVVGEPTITQSSGASSLLIVGRGSSPAYKYAVTRTPARAISGPYLVESYNSVGLGTSQLHFAASGRVFFVGDRTVGNGPGLCYSDDVGQTWTAVALGGSSTYSTGVASNGSYILASEQFGGFYESTDGGDNWTGRTLEDAQAGKGGYSAFSGNFVFGGDNDDALVGPNKVGLVEIDTPLTFGNSQTRLSAIAMDPTGQHIVAGNIFASEDLCSSHDGGATWGNQYQTVGTGFGFYPWSAVYGDGKFVAAGYDPGNQANAFLAYSTDNGDTWTEVQVTGPIDLGGGEAYINPAFSDVVYDGEKWILVGRCFDQPTFTYYAMIAETTDFVNFTFYGVPGFSQLYAVALIP